MGASWDHGTEDVDASSSIAIDNASDGQFNETDSGKRLFSCIFPHCGWYKAIDARFEKMNYCEQEQRFGISSCILKQRKITGEVAVIRKSLKATNERAFRSSHC